MSLNERLVGDRQPSHDRVVVRMIFEMVRGEQHIVTEA